MLFGLKCEKCGEEFRSALLKKTPEGTLCYKCETDMKLAKEQIDPKGFPGDD